MGYICHNAIIVTGWNEHVEQAYEVAARLVNEQAEHIDGVSTAVLSPLSPSVTNGYRSFAIWPDGSKEGWGTSAHGDDLRDSLIGVLDGGDLWVEWCEVRFGDEADMNGMTRCSGEPPQLLPTKREVEESFDAEASGRPGSYGRSPQPDTPAEGER